MRIFSGQSKANIHEDILVAINNVQERVMGEELLIESGRPRLKVDFALVLRLREHDNLGWSRVAKEYTRITGQYISKETCKRRYEELKAKE